MILHVIEIVGGLGAGTLLALVTAWVYARIFPGTDLAIDDLIDAKGSKPRFVGMDDRLRQHSALRRAAAADIRRESTRVLLTEAPPVDAEKTAPPVQPYEPPIVTPARRVH